MTNLQFSRESISRRAFLKNGTKAGSAIFLGSIVATPTPLIAQADSAQKEAVSMVTPQDAAVFPGFLAARLLWEYTAGEAPHAVVLTVASKRNQQHPIVHIMLDGSVTTYALPLVPRETYAWRLQPIDINGRPAFAAVQGEFAMGEVLLKEDLDKDEQFRYVRKNAHNTYFHPTSPFVEEPLSPWYDVKRYTMAPPPKFADVKHGFPQPVFDGHPDVLEAYWYCWKTFLDVWNYVPRHPDHQAVANLNGCPDWGSWGSSQVWDSWTMMHFAKYGHQVYPFISQFDNAYARQHENGFICQESDSDNFEVFVCHPAKCAYLMASAEWDYYLVSADADRLRRVFLPLVKNYEWFMTYMRHKPGGTYGFVTPATRDERCEVGPDNLELGATAFRIVETMAMTRIATLIERADMARFFEAEYQRLADYINQHYWDAENKLYNDRCDPNSLWTKYRDPKLLGKFVTEAIPGDINKSNYTFLPLLAKIAPPERVQDLKRLVQDSTNGFAWPCGIGYYSLNSTPQGNVDDTHDGSRTNTKVWAPIQYLVQQGFKENGEWEVAREIAERYVNAVVACYKTDNTISEAMNASKPENAGHRDFVGWSGLAPISNFIEYILGIDINVPAKIIEWHLHQTDQHGLRHLKMGNFYVDLVCAERATAGAPCHVTVVSEGSFTLRTIVGERVSDHQVHKGEVALQIG